MDKSTVFVIVSVTLYSVIIIHTTLYSGNDSIVFYFNLFSPRVNIYLHALSAGRSARITP